MNKIIFFILLLFSITFVFPQQSSFKKIDLKNYSAKSSLEFRKTTPKKYNLYTLNTNLFKNEVTNNGIISLPINGAFANFKITETSNFTNPLAAKYGYIKSFSLKGMDDKTATGKISIDTQGVHAIIFSGKHSTFYIDPYTKDKSTYISYKREDLNDATGNVKCLFDDHLISKETYKTIKTAQKNPNDGVLRTYRLALACTVEYAAFHINNQGLSNTDTNVAKQAAVLSAMNTTMTRINGVFEKEIAVRMNIIVNANGENELIFIDTDEFSNNDASELIEESQDICDEIIGSENYDIGHTFSTGAGGLAGLGVVCNNNQKGQGVTGTTSPIGDAFDIDLVAHEFGHQFGANHTFNGTTGNCEGTNRNANTAVEPGSGTTIMAYAGICGSQNVQNNSDAYFHAVSIDQMWARIQNTSCATETNTNNTAPTANAGNDFSVPVSTPLILRGEATDIENNSLTYCWEQIDNEIVTVPPLSTNLAGASFRSFPPTSTPERYLPLLSTVLAGSTETEWEVIPSVARNMNFSLVVRDNVSNGGASGRDDMSITFIDTNPFIITSPNSSVEWEVGSSKTITWDKSTTDQAPINCANVRIKLSTDGGETFPFILIESTPNDGSYTFTVPNQITSSARIMVEGLDHIFYNVNNTNFSIISSGPTYTTTNLSENQETCNDNSSLTYELDVEYLNGFSETVTFASQNLPNGVTATISPETINSNSTIIVTLSNFETAIVGNYTISINASSASLDGSIELPTLTVNSAELGNISLNSPINNASNITTEDLLFEWQNTSSDNSSLFELEVATDTDFNTIIISEENLTELNYTYTEFLDFNTTYYWRVKPKNNCGEGNFSSINNFTTEQAGYCQSDFSLVEGNEFITNVTLNAINNDSGNDDTDGIADGYEDFTSISTPLTLNTTYPLNVSFDPVGFQDHCFVFIDWNRDTRFDISTERYDLGFLTENEATLTTEITVPNDATLGETRMRVIIQYFDSQINFGEGACDDDHTSEFGETEDYTILITDSDFSLGINDDVFNNFSLFPNPVENRLNLLFEIPNIEEDTILLISDMAGKIVKSFISLSATNTFNESLDLSELSRGVYSLNIQNGNKETTKKLIIK